MADQIYLYKALELIIKLSLFILFTSIAYDFYKFSEKSDVVKEKKSIVETGSMTAFFLVYYGVIMKQLWVLEAGSGVKAVCAVLGTIMVFAGAVLNVYGRVTLSNNWANHIKIYEDHTLVRTGLYKFVRHPLYATIIFMLIGGSLASRNALSLLLVLAVFVPFMTYRAKQEEALLEAMFPDYTDYRMHTGMFFPKIIGNGGTHDSH